MSLTIALHVTEVRDILKLKRIRLQFFKLCLYFEMKENCENVVQIAVLVF